MQRAQAVTGFTMIEMIVAVSAVLVLAAAALFTFADVEDRGHAIGAAAALDTVVVAQQGLAADFGSYTSWPSDLPVAGAALDLRTGGSSTAVGEVAMVVGTRGTLALATMDDVGRCHLVRVAPVAQGGGVTQVSAAQECAAEAALPAGEVPAEQVAAVRQ